MLSSTESVEEVKRGAVSEFERSSNKVPLGRVCDSKTESDEVLVVGDHGMLVGAKEWFLMSDLTEDSSSHSSGLEFLTIADMLFVRSESSSLPLTLICLARALSKL